MSTSDRNSPELVTHVIRELGMVVFEVDESGLRLIGESTPAWFGACFGSV